MQFLVTGHDGLDDKALERRMAAREAHIAHGRTLKASGNLLFGAALLDANGKMTGSIYVMDFPSRAELEHCLTTEPYVIGNVWQTIDIQPCQAGPAFAPASR